MDPMNTLEAALSLHSRGDLSAALEAVTEALAGLPEGERRARAEAFNLIGAIAVEQGRAEDAVTAYRQAMDMEPDSARHLRGLGRAALAAGRPEEALAVIDKAIAVGGRDADLHCDRAEALIALGDFTAAVAAAQTVVDANRNHARGHLMIGLAHLERGDLDEAMAALGRAVLLTPQDPDANYHRARLAQMRGDLSAAAEYYGRALAERPDFVEAFNNLGNVRRAQGRFLDAEALFRKATEMAPHIAAVHMNHAVALQEIDEDDAALRAYDAALAIDPDLAEARRNRALLWLKKGHLAEGFREYEWRWKTKTFAAVKPPVDAKRWSTEPTDGTVVFWSEQGVGDAIQFIRYAPILKKRMRDGGHAKGRLVVVAPGSLKTLFETVAGVDAVLAPDDPMPDAEWHLPMVSAAHVAGTSFDSIPAGVPYLSASDEARAEWRELALDGVLNVGLVWSGDTRHLNDAQRSIPAGMFEPLLGVPDVRINLMQVGPASDQGMELVRQGARQIGHRFKNFDCTAGAICNLDLVIAVDTAVAHLAGALGKPVWIPLSTVQDWRWFEFLEDSPWYPTARLFRQSESGDWSPVIAEIRAELATLAAAKRTSAKA
jgi:tetratricopeptide (TPR) repeat protein